MSSPQHRVGQAGTLCIAVIAAADGTDTLYPCKHAWQTTLQCDAAVMSAEAQGAAPAAGPPLLATTDVADIVEAVKMLQVRCAQLLICTCLPGPACDTASARPPFLI